MNNNLRKIYRSRVSIDNSFPLSTERLVYNNPEVITTHTHDFCEIGITTDGTALHYFNGNRTNLEKGSIYIIPKGESHKIVVDGDWSVINIYFLPELLEENLNSLITALGIFPLAVLNLIKDKGLLTTRLDSNRLDSIVNHINCIEKYPIQSENLQALYNKNCFINILIILSCSFQQIKNIDIDSRIVDIITFIHTNIEYETKSLLKMISNNYNLSSHYINTIFKKYVDSTISSYIIKAKILRSCSMLLEFKNVTEIALSLGFYDHSHYIKYFKKYIGVSPKQYTKKYANIDNK